MHTELERLHRVAVASAWGWQAFCRNEGVVFSAEVEHVAKRTWNEVYGRVIDTRLPRARESLLDAIYEANRAIIDGEVEVPKIVVPDAVRMRVR